MFKYLFLVSLALCFFHNGWAQPCSGTPIGGTVSASTYVPCGANIDTLRLSGYTTGSGITLQWQSSTDGLSWPAIPGATGSSYDLSASASRYYRAMVKCSFSGDSAFSDTVYITYDTLCPCIPVYTSGFSLGYRIYAFDLTGYSGSSISDPGAATPSGYELRPDTIRLRQGDTYTGMVATTGILVSCENQLWIDFNNNGVFEASESVTPVFGDSLSGHDFSLMVPLTADSGYHRMRVRAAYTYIPYRSAQMDPCYLDDNSLGSPMYYDDGSTWDYTAYIIYKPSCMGTPSAGVISADNCSFCGGDSLVSATSCTDCGPDTVSLNSLGMSADSTNLFYQWEYSADSITWADIPGATSLPYKFVPLNTFYYRLNVTCAVSGDSSFSNVINVYYESSCPCIPEYAGFPDFTYQMNSFGMTGYDGTYIHDTDVPTIYLGMFADRTCSVPVIDLQQGATYADTVYVRVASSGGYQTAQVWIDLNDDGIFDTSEAVSAIYGCLSCSTLYPTVTLPDSAARGLHRMRVRYAQSTTTIGYPTMMDPCALNYTFDDYYGGNAFDYLVYIIDSTIITPTLKTPATQNTLADIYPNPTHTSITITATNKINQIAITNLLGQTLCEHKYDAEQVQIDVANLPAGMYLIRINGTEVRKFVKE